MGVAGRVGRGAGVTRRFAVCCSQFSGCGSLFFMERKRREIRVRHEAGVPEEVAGALRTERELERLIAGEEKVDQRAVAEVVARVQVVIADYLESGKGLGMVLKPVEIVSAIEAALAEANGVPSPFPDGADARTFFVHGLYDEIVQQPSNMFETRVFPDGSERYVPVGRAVWWAGLEKVRARIVEAKR